MTQDQNNSPSLDISPPEDSASAAQREEGRVVSFFRNLIKPKLDISSLRETIEEFVDDKNSENVEESMSTHEKSLISNILKVRNLTAADVMVPRADIVAVSTDSTQEELFTLLADKQYSRLPVYNETLDDVIGTIHAKDILAALARGEKINMPDLIREVPVISPAMPILDLLLQMRLTRKHMALVVDEFGGIDGLITIADLIEAIVGEMYDEHDPDDEVQLIERPDGTVIADARFNLVEFEERFGKFFSEDEHQENDTIGGVVLYLAARLPARGEVFNHPSGIVFEVLDADARRIKRLCIGNIPKQGNAS